MVGGEGALSKETHKQTRVRQKHQALHPTAVPTSCGSLPQEIGSWKKSQIFAVDSSGLNHQKMGTSEESSPILILTNSKFTGFAGTQFNKAIPFCRDGVVLRHGLTTSLRLV